MATSGSIFGNAVVRREDPALLTGEARYFDDLAIEGLAHVVFVRSTVAHARLLSVDTRAATSQPGVLAVYAGDDLDLGPVQGMGLIDAKLSRPPLAIGKVRFVGDIVAAVVAETRGQALDAAELVVVDYDPLPAVTDGRAALAEGAPLLFEDHGSNQAFQTELGTDSDPLEDAETVVGIQMVSQRLAGVPMEGNGIIAVPGEPEGGLTAWVPTQGPFGVQGYLANTLGLKRPQIRVRCAWVGGGFGPKNGGYVEFVITAAAALRLGRPVKWTETRSEDMVSLLQGRDMAFDARLGLGRDGTLTGLDIEAVANAGAYPAVGAFLPTLTQLMAQGVYRIPKIRFRAVVAATNTTTVGAYRGAGRPEATQLLERLLDAAADELGVDPAELRRRNFLQPEEFPLRTRTNAFYDSGDHERALDAALQAAGYDALRADQAARRARGDRRLLGIGVASYVEVTAPMGLHKEYGSVEVHPDGTVTAKVGTSAHGQGHETAFSMVIAEVLGVPMESVRLVQSDTALVRQGSGTAGSRSLQTAGSALHTAGNAVLDKAKQLAAHLLEADPADIVKSGGGLAVAGTPSKGLRWGELAAAAADAHRLPEGMEPGLVHELVFDGKGSTFPFGTHVAVVEIDADTGLVTLLRHIAVDDCGRVLNPLLVAGQQHGGIAQGVAQALYEWVQYDEDANPVTASLLAYAVPSAAELPSFEVSNNETPSPNNPLGAKGIGESGTIGSTPAVHNAVVDALSHLGVRHVEMPCTPERVWRAMHSIGATAGIPPRGPSARPGRPAPSRCAPRGSSRYVRCRTASCRAARPRSSC